MSTEIIEQKLTEMERRLAALEAATFQRKPKGAWREVIGWEEDDALFGEAVQLGAEWRAQANTDGR